MKHFGLLEHLFESNSHMSSPALGIEFHRLTGVMVCSRTIQRWRVDMGFRAAPVIPKLVLNAPQRLVRLDYCEALLDEPDFERWWFSDESYFKFGGKAFSNLRVWIRPGASGEENRFIFHDERHSYRLMVWGAISIRNASKLYFLNANETSESYADMLQSDFFLFADEVYGGRDQWVFLQYNVRPHTGG